MMRFVVFACVVLCVLACGSGCAGDEAAKAQWREALRDAHGDNMRMGSRPAATGLYD